MTTEGS